MKSALLTYIGLLEVDEPAFPSLVDVLGKNRYPKFSFRQIRSLRCLEKVYFGEEKLNVTISA